MIANCTNQMLRWSGGWDISDRPVGDTVLRVALMNSLARSNGKVYRPLEEMPPILRESVLELITRRKAEKNR